MFKRRFTAISVVVATLVVAAVLTGATGPFGGSSDVIAQPAFGHSTMQDRLDQVIGVLQDDPGEAAAMGAIEQAMEVLYGGLRVLPSPDVPETENADQATSAAEQALADALENFVRNGDKDNPAKGAALDAKLFIEQMNEVAAAVGEITRQCGDRARLDQAPCDELRPLLDDETGDLRESRVDRVESGFHVKLRSPRVFPWFSTTGWDEDVIVTEPIPRNRCAVVFKETRGLAVQLKFQRITTVTDPWVATFGVPRGTRVPIWTMEWVPTEYVKEWNLCNKNGEIVKTVTRRVVQDVPLNFFWRLYGGGGGHNGY